MFEGRDEDGDGVGEWPAQNSAGQRVATGVYAYVITGTGGEKKMGKLAVAR
jgi:hypothetical protein